MFRIVLWPPLLLCCLLCGKTMALILAFAAGGQSGSTQCLSVPLHLCSHLSFPHHLLTFLLSFLPSPSVCVVWSGGSLRVYSAPVLVGSEVAAAGEGAACQAEAILHELAAVVKEENFTRTARVTGLLLCRVAGAGTC